ncbi:MAG: 3-dehydroquinate synthase [Alphaproteobacteria bacterium]|jgi:3-dehydroquinate synthase|nr:3-dehydroquinate synthase [Alphaproteobacteria bacterium]
MTQTTTVRVALDGRGYDIVIGGAVLDSCGERVAKLAGHGRVVVVTDETVADLHLPALRAALAAAEIAPTEIVLPAGERTKDFTHLQQLLDRLLETGVARDSIVVALGGGVIGDLAGFAASVVLRGIDLIQIPTTLLAQVDSSVGGKTGINSAHGKNLIGSFHQPRLVLADIDVLDTLPERELVAGYGEVVKYGLIADPAFLAWLEEHGRAVIAGDAQARRHAIATCCAAKARLVGDDEREHGRRALLNLGHTFGHALEAESGFTDSLRHGEAVAIGTILAFEYSVALGLCPAEDLARVRRHFTAVGLPTAPPALGAVPRRAQALLAHMTHDKKVRDGRPTFVLMRGIGQAFLYRDAGDREVLAVLEQAIAA